MIGITRTMWCLVNLPNSMVMEVYADPKADAQDCLQKVLDHLDIIESDYFGLQYAPQKDSSSTWLNLRNPLDQQLTGNGPHRLRLRVKFFVPPHRILQATTLQQFYLHIKQALADGDLGLITQSQVATLAAAIAQAETGDQRDGENMAAVYQALLPQSMKDSTDLISSISEAHKQFAGIQESSAKYSMLQKASEMECYGVEFFQVFLESSTASLIYGSDGGQKSSSEHNVGVGPEGITIYNAKWKAKIMYPYPRVHRITSYSRSFRLLIFDDDGSDFPLDFRLHNKTAANAIYRCMTEMYSFYLCETVRDVVVSQFSRDLKGTLASLFNENSSVGKKYTFDIQRTSQEAYDHYRRVLYKAECHQKIKLTSKANSSPIPMEVDTSDSDGELASSCDSVLNSLGSSCGKSNCGVKCNSVKEQLKQMKDAVLCCVCADNTLSIVFKPCHHVVCCSECAERLEVCPVCRHDIEERHTIYMPTLPGRDDGIVACRL